LEEQKIEQLTEIDAEPEVNNEAGPEVEMEEKPAKRKGGFFVGMMVGILVGGAIFTCTTIGLKYFALKRMENIGAVASQSSTSSGNIVEDTMEKIQELYGYINLYYYEDVDTEALEKGIYHGIVEGVGDKYSAYYTAEEYTAQKVNSRKVFAGIGATISIDTETEIPCIAKVNDDSPAMAAGLKAGDLFVEVDGLDVTSFSVEEVVSHVRGDEGSVVHLKMYREGEADYIEVDITRAIINIPTVAHQMLENNIGLIEISDFGQNTDQFFVEAVEDLNTQGMQKLIIDVRGNPGGMVSAVTSILDYILPAGTVVYTEDKYGNRKDYTSDGEHFMMCDIAVLIDANSASASEILAGAIRDYQYGTLVGKKTFGKGIVQTIFDLKDGDAIKLTTSSYYTPNGENIHGKGIEPDVEVDYEYTGEATEKYDPMKDSQVLKAIEILEQGK